MDHPLISLIDDMVAKAQRDGQFDDLAGAGKPLPPVDDPANAVVDRIMQESGTKPQAVLLLQQLTAARAHLAAVTDPQARKAAMKTVADLETRLAIARDAMTRHG